MNDKAYKEKTFIIHLDEIKYCIELLNKNPHHTRFKVSTECEYMFTLCADENGNCGIEHDFTPLHTNLVDEVGKAIEKYGVH